MLQKYHKVLIPLSFQDNRVTPSYRKCSLVILWHYERDNFEPIIFLFKTPLTASIGTN
jgi:hypothetical protein